MPAKFGDKFGESLSGSQAPPRFWKVPGLPRKFPNFPRSFSATSPEVLSLWNLINSNPEVPRKFPKLPRKFPRHPHRGQPVSMVRSFEMGLAGRGDWREEILPMPEIQASFLCHFSYATLGRRGTQFWRSTFAVFWPPFVANPSRQPLFETFDSGVAPANQTKERSVHGLFTDRGILEEKFNVNCACLPKEKHQNSQKWAKFMNFSFWPFLWFGLPGRLLIDMGQPDTLS